MLFPLLRAITFFALFALVPASAFGQAPASLFSKLDRYKRLYCLSAPLSPSIVVRVTKGGEHRELSDKQVRRQKRKVKKAKKNGVRPKKNQRRLRALRQCLKRVYIPTPDEGEENGPSSGSNGGEDDGDPTSPTPPAPFCGDGITQANEECDDGNLTIGDGCAPDCSFEIYSTTDVLSLTPSGALYHRENCSPENNQGKIIVHMAGTRSNTQYSPITYFSHVGELSGLCLISLPYNNQRNAVECCSPKGDENGLPDLACRKDYFGAKYNAQPPEFTCLDNITYSIAYEDSVLGTLETALLELDLQNYFDLIDEKMNIHWNKIFLTGHSQGGTLAGHLAVERHNLHGAFTFAGFPSPEVGTPAYQTPLTDPSRISTFFHWDNFGPIRVPPLQAFGLPPANIMITYSTEPECTTFPGKASHRCIISHDATPLYTYPSGMVLPLFLPEWLRGLGEQLYE